MWNNLPDYVVMLILLILSKTDLMHIGNTYICYFIIEQPIHRNRRLEFILSIRKLMSVVKDVDLEAMPTSIFSMMMMIMMMIERTPLNFFTIF